MRRRGCEGAKVRGCEGARVRRCACLAVAAERRRREGALKTLAAMLLGVLFFGATVEIQAQGRGRGGPPAPPGRPGAPVDLVGTWVSVVTEDWQWRMRTPAKGDTTSVPLNGEGNRVANTWEPSMDGRCEAYGVGGLMRMPLRVKISWQDDLTLKIETGRRPADAASAFRRPRVRRRVPSALPLDAHCRGHPLPSGSAAAVPSTRSSSAAPAPRLRGGARSK